MFVNIWPGDWSQFLAGLVATVIGIFGPFYLQSIIERRNKRQRAIQYLNDIKKELKSIKEQLLAVQTTDIYINPIKTPMWDSLINTNEIQLLSLLNIKRIGSNVANPTKQIFQIYDLINEYNSWWNMYSQGAVVGSRSQKELESIKAFVDQLKFKLLCKEKNDENYSKSILSTLDVIDSVLRQNKRGCKKWNKKEV